MFPAVLPHTVRLVRRLQYQFARSYKTRPRFDLSTYQHRSGLTRPECPNLGYMYT